MGRVRAARARRPRRRAFIPSLRSLSCAAIVLASLAHATIVAAQDAAAYGRLLAAHVRPVLIDSVRLNAVDYAALKTDPDYARALAHLARARTGAFRSDAEAIAFWVNAYNLLAIKAVVDRYPVRSITDGGSLLQSIWKKRIGTVGGKALALDDIEHGILRARFREPRVHMAIVCASLSCPDLRTEPYVAERLDAQLDEATRMFLANPAKGLSPGGDGQTTHVSAIFRWFAADFGGPEGVLRFIRAHAVGAPARQLADVTAARLAYLPYDWTLNDARRDPDWR